MFSGQGSMAISVLNREDENPARWRSQSDDVAAKVARFIYLMAARSGEARGTFGLLAR